MLELTSSFLRSLAPPKPVSYYKPVRAAESTLHGVSDTSAPSSDCTFADLYDDPEVRDIDGTVVPKRLVQWFMSPTKRDSIIMLLNDDTDAARSDCGFDAYKGGYLFWVRRSDKRRGYYSTRYNDLDDAMDDLQYLLEKIAQCNASLANLLLETRMRQFREKTKKGENIC